MSDTASSHLPNHFLRLWFIRDQESTLFTHQCQRFDNLVKTAGCTTFLREATDGKIDFATMFENGEELAYKMHGFEMEDYKGEDLVSKRVREDKVGCETAGQDLQFS